MQEEPKAEKDFQPSPNIMAPALLKNASNDFPKSRRLLTRFDYDRVFKRSKRINSQHFQLIIHLNKSTDARMGMIVSRKVDKTAVGRNRIKRQIRESFRLMKALHPGDYVVLAKVGKGLNLLKKNHIRKELDQLWSQAIELMNGMKIK